MPNLFPYIRCLSLVVLLSATCLHVGCRWNPFKRTVVEPSPVLFLNGQPTLQEISLAVSSNTNRVQQMTSQGATLRVPGLPAIGADIALQRPLGFRFRAATALTGSEADFGSNNELFWFWIARSPQPALFYARHDQFASSPMRAQMPVDPTWLVEALGLTEINPQQVWEGPFAIGEDRVEIRTRVPSPAGELTKSIVVHNRFGWILQQQMTDAQGQLVASSVTSNHQYYPVDGVSLPQRIDVNIPAFQGAFQMDVDRWQVNALSADPQVLFALPRDQLRSYPLVDLAAPNNPSMPAQNVPVNAPYGAPAGAGFVPPQAQLQRVSTLPGDDYRQRIRGLTTQR